VNLLAPFFVIRYHRRVEVHSDIHRLSAEEERNAALDSAAGDLLSIVPLEPGFLPS
jgi:hypothetical protein